jgi:hypothetical protein
VELFFKWIKQHLRIKAFFGTSENAVKTQIWIAVSVFAHAGRSVCAAGRRSGERETIAPELSGGVAGSGSGGTRSPGNGAEDTGSALSGGVKTLEEFDFQVVPHISVAVMRNLSAFPDRNSTRDLPGTCRTLGRSSKKGWRR